MNERKLLVALCESPAWSLSVQQLRSVCEGRTFETVNAISELENIGLLETSRPIASWAESTASDTLVCPTAAARRAYELLK